MLKSNGIWKALATKNEPSVLFAIIPIANWLIEKIGFFVKGTILQVKRYQWLGPTLYYLRRCTNQVAGFCPEDEIGVYRYQIFDDIILVLC